MMKTKSVTLRACPVLGDDRTDGYKVSKARNYMGHRVGDYLTEAQVKTLMTETRHLDVNFV